jgi:ATP-dependent Clp endopeptidase proteolytic subunit ClpP
MFARLQKPTTSPQSKTSGRTWYEIRAATDDKPAEVFIYDVIAWYGVFAKDFVRDLAALEADEILVRISSPGGDVFDGMAIYNALRDHPATITSRVEGFAASIASIIALAGESVEVHESAFLMIHDPWGYAVGNATELRALADTLDKLAGSMVDIYARKTGMDPEEIRDLMAAETWYTGAEAVETGLADVLLTDSAPQDEDSDAQASVDLSGFRNPPEALAGDTPPPDDELELMRRRLRLMEHELD